jgi:UDP-N-acetylmuramyl pentapeptide synthase
MEEVMNSEAAHLEIAETLIEQNINQVFLIGEKTKPMMERVNNSQWYPDVEKFIENINNLDIKNSVILIKASRAASLEKVEKYL